MSFHLSALHSLVVQDRSNTQHVLDMHLNERLLFRKVLSVCWADRKYVPRWLHIKDTLSPQLSHYSVLAVYACGIQYINWLINLLIGCCLMLSEQYFSYMNVESQFYHDNIRLYGQKMLTILKEFGTYNYIYFLKKLCC
jgi:hypothetical protein